MYKKLKNSFFLNLFALLCYIPAVDIIRWYFSDKDFTYAGFSAKFLINWYYSPLLIAAIILVANELLILKTLKLMHINLNFSLEKITNNILHNLFLIFAFLSFVVVFMTAIYY